ncbi:MAG: hypothetical protein JSR91_26775 [Proteobacteria bacterium]|nr:hypothetical protein [Pseudomonadota bacterium]
MACASGLFGRDVGATWKQVPGLHAKVNPGRGLLVDPQQLRNALGEEAANRILNTPGIMPMAKPPSEERPPSGHGDNPSDTPSEPDQEPPKEPPPPALPKPKGIPDEWIAKPSKKQGGMRYFNPKNAHDQVRVMPGNPKSPNPFQQRPYIVDRNNGRVMDRNGQPIEGANPEKSPDAHIPYEDYTFRR